MPLAYPYGESWGSYLDPKSRKDELRTSLMNILFTRKGEKVMRGDFGAGIEDEVFEPLDDMEGLRLKSIISEEVMKWDPRLEVVDVSVSGMLDPNGVMVRVVYRESKSRVSGEFSFYLERG